MPKSCDENEGTPQNTPNADEGHPSEDPPQQAEGNLQASGESVREEADGSLRGEPAQASPEPKEDTPTRRLNPEEVVRGVDALERLREEIKSKKHVREDAPEANIPEADLTLCASGLDIFSLILRSGCCFLSLSIF